MGKRAGGEGLATEPKTLVCPFLSDGQEKNGGEFSFLLLSYALTPILSQRERARLPAKSWHTPSSLGSLGALQMCCRMRRLNRPGERATLKTRTQIRILLSLVSVCLCPSFAHAQDNYEIQVYPSETVSRGVTMVELHNNFTAKGPKKTDDGTLPTNHAWHETIEITHGFNDWFETGFYIFTSARNGSGWDFVGTHIRPRFRVPPKWQWPVGVSLSQEIGYVRRKFSEDTWSWEIRPIIDKELKRWYVSFNPAIERALNGPGAKRGFTFAPNFKVAYSITKKIDGGLEYYGALGPLSGFDPKREQQHQIFPAIDLNVSPKWEFNFGVGIGMTRSTDHLIFKMIIGRRFTFGRKQSGSGNSGVTSVDEP